MKKLITIVFVSVSLVCCGQVDVSEFYRGSRGSNTFNSDTIIFGARYINTAVGGKVGTQMILNTDTAECAIDSGIFRVQFQKEMMIETDSTLTIQSTNKNIGLNAGDTLKLLGVTGIDLFSIGSYGVNITGIGGPGNFQSAGNMTVFSTAGSATLQSPGDATLKSTSADVSLEGDSIKLTGMDFNCQVSATSFVSSIDHKAEISGPYDINASGAYTLDANPITLTATTGNIGITATIGAVNITSNSANDIVLTSDGFFTVVADSNIKLDALTNTIDFFTGEAFFATSIAGANFLFTTFQNSAISGSQNTAFGNTGSTIKSGNMNSLFGNSAGGILTKGFKESFFGDGCGALDTAGHDNSAFGHSCAPQLTGNNTHDNSFFGEDCGSEFREGVNSSFYGAQSGMPIEDTSTFIIARNAFGIGSQCHNNHEMVFGQPGNLGATDSVSIWDFRFGGDRGETGEDSIITFYVPKAIGTDIPGYGFEFVTSIGTGSGTTNPFKFYTGTIGGSSSTSQTRGERFRINSTLVSANVGFNSAVDAQGDDNYEVAIPIITSLNDGTEIRFKANTANTGPATIEITSEGSLMPLLKMHDQALVTGDIEAGQWVVCIIDESGNCQVTSQLAQ